MRGSTHGRDITAILILALAVVVMTAMIPAGAAALPRHDEERDAPDAEAPEDIPHGEELRVERDASREKLEELLDGGETADYAAAWSATAAADWVDPYRVSEGDFGIYWWPSMDVDGAGNLHVAYMDPINLDILYASNQGGSWSAPISILGDDLFGMCPDIFVDDWNNVHVAYMTQDEVGDVIHVVSRWDDAWGPTWRASGADDECWLPSLVRESGPGATDSKLHVAYISDESGFCFVKHNQTAGWGGGAWNPASVVASGLDDDCDYPSLGIDSGDGLHLAYEFWDAAGDANVQYNSRPYGGAWGLASENASGGETDALMPSLAVGAGDEPYVSYTWDDWSGTGDMVIRGNHRDNATGWGAPATASGGDTICTDLMWQPALGLPTRGSMLAYDAVSGGLFVAYVSMEILDGIVSMKCNYYDPVGGFGTPETVWGADQNMQADLVVDAAGAPLVIWVHQDQLWFPNDLYLSTRTGPASWSGPASVPSATTAVMNCDAVVDGDGLTHVVAWEYGGGAHKVRYFTGDAQGSWNDHGVISGDDKGCVYPRVAVGPDGLARVCYLSLGWIVPFLPLENQMRYVADGGGWSAPVTISGADIPDGISAIGVDGTGTTHVAYYDDDAVEIHYVNNASGWCAPETISGGDTGDFLVAATCDSSGGFHVVYPDEPGGGDWRIRYAARSSSGAWSGPSTISGGEDDVDAPDIVSLSDGSLEVVYVADVDGSRDYRLRDTSMPAGGAWSAPFTLGADSDCGDPSLAVDPEDGVHLFYMLPFSSLPCDLRYMYYDACSWSDPETVVPGIEPASFLWYDPVCSAAATPEDIPCCLYEDGASLYYVAEEVVPEFYFAEGYTGEGFQEYLCLANAGAEEAVAAITYMFTDGSEQEQRIAVPPTSRVTVDVNAVAGQGEEVSAKVVSDRPIACERPMYFSYQGAWDGGHVTSGVPSPSSDWYFAEGCTTAGFETYVCVQNPGDDHANLTFRFHTQEEGEKVISDFVVAPHSRATFLVNDLLGGGYQTSLHLSSTSPVVAERPVYFSYSGTSGYSWEGGHCVAGSAELSSSYYFAEGTTRAGFETWLCLQNPGSEVVTVEASYFLGDGQGAEVKKSYDLGPGRRLTLNLADEVGDGVDVSTRLSSASHFLAERPSYFDYGGNWPGGHCVMGAGQAGISWLFAEGYTGDSNSFDTWLCLGNPGGTNAHVRVSYYSQEAGALPPQDLTVLAGTRVTLLLDDQVGGDHQLAIEITSDEPVVAERAMYFDYDGRTGGHANLGN
ncbi:MAG: DUF5719 family protein [Actinomycetota bacterium]|nr:DUF5719 family protein [Actinomycetota bacterium]